MKPEPEARNSHAQDPAADELALVMSGGGARAAYQVGFLRCLARLHPELSLPILTGTSAGAINAAFLASHAGDFGERVEALAELWSQLEADQVFSVGPLGLFTQVMRWGGSLLSGGLMPLEMRGLVETQPLREMISRALNCGANGIAPGIARNLEQGDLKAVALTAANYTSGQSITWVQGRRIVNWERVHRIGREDQLGVEHVMASSALPLFFPAIWLDGAFYGDGGMRQTAPLSPAIHLGAKRILAISTRHSPTKKVAGSTPPEAQISGYPPPARVAGMILNALFLDQLDSDALRLERINRLLRELPDEKRDGLRPLKLLVMRPSRDLGVMANEFEPRLPRTFRWLTRGLGTKKTRGNDFLSLVMFQGDYLRRLIALGEEDAEAQRADIEAFLGEPID
ncbi:MAG: NTE family protein [Planctomycetota bacterium]|jgi:NTE family protein